MFRTNKRLIFFLCLIVLLPGCGIPFFSSPVSIPVPTRASSLVSAFTPTITATNTTTSTASPTASPTPTTTGTPAPTPTATITPTPTQTQTPTPSLTPTFELPKVVVNMQANCRYGPGTAYLYSHGLYQGDTGVVGYRNFNGTWLWIKPDTLNRYCWVSTSVVTVIGDIFSVKAYYPALPFSTFYYPPKNVKTSREGNKVTVTWDRVPMTEDDDRGYLLEANVCQNGNLVPLAVQTNNTHYTFKDDQNCPEKSSAKLYTVDKHGYSKPVKVRWPK